MPRTILTRYNLKPSKLLGEPSYPFDLAVFGMIEITKILQTDFKEFFCNLEYNGKIWVKKNILDFDNNCIEFHHEKFLTENDKEKLISIYNRRIENFRKSVKENTPIVFFQITSDITEAENHYKEIQNIRNDKPFKFLIVNTGEQRCYFLRKNFKILDLKFPCEAYKREWWLRKYYSAPYGIEFEMKITEFFKNNSMFFEN